MILFANSEGPDKTAWMHRLILADLGHHSQHMPKDTFSHDVAQIKGGITVNNSCWLIVLIILAVLQLQL